MTSAQYQLYAGKFTLASDETQFNVLSSPASKNCTINTGDYYLFGYDTETTEQLVEHIQNTIRDQAGHANAIVTVDPVARRVDMGFTNTVNVYFDDLSVANILGFESQLDAGWINSAQHYRGDKQPRYLWGPTRGLAETPLHINTVWDQRSTTKITRAPSGKVSSVQGNLLYDGFFRYVRLPSADVISTPGESDNWRPLEQFWADVVHKGKTIRMYYSRDASNSPASENYKTGTWCSDISYEGAMDVGGFAEQVGRNLTQWDSLWDVEFALLKDV